MPERLDDLVEDLVELDGWFVPYQRTDLADIRYPSRHVFEAGFVRLIVRNADDLRVAAGERLHLLGEIVDRDLVSVPDIEDLAHCARLVDQGYHGAYNVAD